MKEELTDLSLFRWIEAFYTGGSILWSCDGQTLYTTCGNVIKTTNLKDGVPSHVIGNEDENLRITCAALSNTDGSIIVSYSNGLIRQYVLPTSQSGTAEIKRQWKSTHSAPIGVMRFTSDSSLLATGSADFSIKIWSLNNKSCVGAFKGTAAVSEMLFVDNSRILIGCADGSVRLFKLKGEKHLIRDWRNHSSQVVSMFLLSDSIYGIASRDQTISLINIETMEKTRTLPTFEPIESAVMNDARLLYTVGEEGVLKCWKPDTAHLMKSKKISGTRLDIVLYNHTCQQLLIGSSDFNIFVVDEKTLTVVRQMVGFNDEIFDVCFVGRNEMCIAVAANSPELRLYDMNTWACHLVPGHSASIMSVSSAKWDPDLLATSSKDNSIIVWNVSVRAKNDLDCRMVAAATGHTNSVTSVKMSNLSKKPFIVSVSYDTTIKLWSLEEVKGRVTKECYKLTACSTLVAHTKDVTCLDISLNDRVCVTGSMDKTARLWRIDTDKMTLGIGGILQGHRRGIWDVKFAPTAQVVATCCGDCSVRVYSVADRECLATLIGHPSAVLKAIFVNNSTQLLTGDSGGLLKVWNIKMKECEATFEAHDDKIWALLANKDESRFITAGSDGRIRIWADVSEKKREEEQQIRAKKVRDDQTLSNLLEQKRFDEALTFSLTLAKPYNCLKIVNTLIASGASDLHNAIEKLVPEQIVVLLDFASQWNTNSRTSDASQRVLQCILCTNAPEELLKLPNITSVVESFIPYTNRHFERLTKAQQNCAFLNYVWSQMRLPDVPVL
ncbi:hypothetical protein AB6A40_002617 [Gnathostoma spinigerum]|uniref:U3 small nucleolar RNA-associated protein 13 C-terminal domain-containing protein n=1 Tax=Gnathostoma spinigerum TaxID=75299 RepID=A0ABD6E728_9BILA